MEKNVPAIALTGGPCGGKSTAKTMLQQKLGDYGHYPIFVSEAATLLIESGITPIGDAFDKLDFQRRALSLSLALEHEGREAARTVRHPRPVIITDRGIADQKPYVGRMRDFEKLLREFGIGKFGDVLARYDAVMHLRTAALGAEQFYTLENNPARYETPAQARRRDQRSLDAWMGHEHLRIFGNESSFEHKMKRLLAEICVFLGIPEPLEIERKFLVDPRIPLEKLGTYQHVAIEQFYLASKNADEGLRLRKREQYGTAVYYRTLKRPGADPSSRYETQEMVTPAEYEFGKQFQKPGTRVVRKERTCFVYENQYFELDRFIDPVLPYALLEIELADPAQPIRLPPFLAIEREVTEDKSYSNYALAHY